MAALNWRSGWRVASEEEWCLSPYQIGLLCFVLISGTAVLSLPEILTSYAGQEAWLAALLPAPVGLIPLWLLYQLDRRRPGLTLPQQARAVLGPVLGGMAGLAWAFFLSSTAPIVLREFASLVSGEALPRTPEVVVLALLMLVPLLMARQGLEPIAYVAAVLTPLAAGTLLVIFLPSLGVVRGDRLLPVTGPGWGPLLQASAPTAAFYAETSLLAFVLPLRGCPRAAAWRAAAAGLGVTALVVAGATLWSLLVFGPLTARLTSTLFQVTRVASVAEFITHMDALLIAVWVAGGLTKVALWFLSLCVSTAQSLGLRDYRSLTLPLAAFTVAAGQGWFHSNADLTRWIARIWPFWGLTFEVGLPLVIWLASLLRDAWRPGEAQPPGGRGSPASGGGRG